jgi:HAD superfamily hydrolase (TIGR01509 family)
MAVAGRSTPQSQQTASPTSVVDAMKPAIALDWGGVLVTDGSRTAWTALERELGIPVDQSAQMWADELQEQADRGELSEDDVWAALASLRAGVCPRDIRRIFLDEYVEISHGVAVLRAACAAGWTTILATNNVRAWIDWWRQRYEWVDLLDVIACSSDMGTRKPEAGYYEALRRMVDLPLVYFVDDDPENVHAAKQAGFSVRLAGEHGEWEPPPGIQALIR